VLSTVFAAGLAARRSTTPPNAGLNWEHYR
jgi:hypothetical protein